MKIDSAKALSRNILLLMLEKGLRYSDFDNRDVGIKGRMVRLIVQDGQTLSVAKLDALAHYLGVKPWQLLDPDMPIQSVTDGRLQALIEAFKSANEESKEFIAKVVERENKQ